MASICCKQSMYSHERRTTLAKGNNCSKVTAVTIWWCFLFLLLSPPPIKSFFISNLIRSNYCISCKLFLSFLFTELRGKLNFTLTILLSLNKRKSDILIKMKLWSRRNCEKGSIHFRAIRILLVRNERFARKKRRILGSKTS